MCPRRLRSSPLRRRFQLHRLVDSRLTIHDCLPRYPKTSSLTPATDLHCTTPERLEEVGLEEKFTTRHHGLFSRPLGQQRPHGRRAGQVLCQLRSLVQSAYPSASKGARHPNPSINTTITNTRHVPFAPTTRSVLFSHAACSFLHPGCGMLVVVDGHGCRTAASEPCSPAYAATSDVMHWSLHPLVSPSPPFFKPVPVDRCFSSTDSHSSPLSTTPGMMLTAMISIRVPSRQPCPAQRLHTPSQGGRHLWLPGPRVFAR